MRKRKILREKIFNLYPIIYVKTAGVVKKNIEFVSDYICEDLRRSEELDMDLLFETKQDRGTNIATWADFDERMSG